MTEAEFPFKVGDTAWFVSRSDTRRCTVLSLNKWKFAPYAVATVSIELADGQRMTCLPETLHREAPPKVERDQTFEEVLAGFRCMPGDEGRNPLPPPAPFPESFPEPLCTPEMATLENLAEQIADWEASVRGFSHGFDCSEEYQHDLIARESVHGVVNGLRQKGGAIPAELQARLDEADRWFMALTRDDSGVWHDAERYDRAVFWYYFRWLV